MSKAASLAATQRRRAMQRVAARLAERFVSVRIDLTETGVQASGRWLNRRWLNDPATRFMGTGK